MTRKTASFLLFAALVLGCGRSQTAQRNDPNYQVVQEGQASGVTSTISGPGETPPPMTNTSADTTTNFTLPDNPAPLGTQPATVAGAYPPQPQPKRRTPPPPTDTTELGPPATDTTATKAPPPPTDTAKTDTTKTDTTKTDTAPPPPKPPV